MFQNKLHCQAAIIQTFVLVVLPQLSTDRSFGKVRDENDERWKIKLLEISAHFFVVFWGFLVQLGAIWVLRTWFVPGKVSLKMEQFKYVQDN